jgi:hypothetical protein
VGKKAQWEAALVTSGIDILTFRGHPEIVPGNRMARELTRKYRRTIFNIVGRILESGKLEYLLPGNFIEAERFQLD